MLSKPEIPAADMLRMIERDAHCTSATDLRVRIAQVRAIARVARNDDLEFAEALLLKLRWLLEEQTFQSVH